jgi:predicted transcriptional regulator
MKSISTIEAEITRIKDELSKLQMKQDKLTLKLKELLEQKRNYEAKEIMDAYLKSGKSYEELMTFLQV